MNNLTISIPEAARLLGCSRTALTAMCRRKELKGIQRAKNSPWQVNAGDVIRLAYKFIDSGRLRADSPSTINWPGITALERRVQGSQTAIERIRQKINRHNENPKVRELAEKLGETYDDTLSFVIDEGLSSINGFIDS